MSVSPSADPACDVLLSAARGNSPGTGRKCHALLSLIETCQSLSTWLRRELARSNLTENGFRLLAQVIRRETEGVTPTDIATGLGLPRQVVSATLGRLEVSGLITRERSAGDRRTFTLKVTPEGRRVFSSALTHCVQSINRVMSTLEPQDVARLDDTCVQLRQFFTTPIPAPT